MRFAALWAQLLFPPRCVLCFRLLRWHQTDLCVRCRIVVEAKRPAERKLSRCPACLSALSYEGDARLSIHRYKFQGVTANAPAYGRLMAMRLLGTRFGQVDLITWVPVSKKRKRSRGYDQTELLARSLARELGFPVAAMLKKITHNQAQSRMKSPEERKQNVRGAYRACIPEGMQSKRILLVDDVMTTGATLTECSTTLRSAGAKQVLCATLATTPEQNESRYHYETDFQGPWN